MGTEWRLDKQRAYRRLHSPRMADGCRTVNEWGPSGDWINRGLIDGYTVPEWRMDVGLSMNGDRVATG